MGGSEGGGECRIVLNPNGYDTFSMQAPWTSSGPAVQLSFHSTGPCLNREPACARNN